jgi:hypothetical protein
LIPLEAFWRRQEAPEVPDARIFKQENKRLRRPRRLTCAHPRLFGNHGRVENAGTSSTGRPSGQLVASVGLDFMQEPRVGWIDQTVLNSTSAGFIVNLRRRGLDTPSLTFVKLTHSAHK